MKLRQRVRKAYYARFCSGDDYFCVFCGSSFSRFLPSGSNRPILRRLEVVGAGKRDNLICPNCFSKHRARLLYLYCKERTTVFAAPHRMLHIAPDPHLAESFFHADTIDYVCGGIDNAGIERFNPVKIDVTAIPFGDDEFDVVLCNHVLVYVADDERGLQQIHRVLKPGGFAIIQVPIALALQETYEIPDGVEINRANTVSYCGHSYTVRLYGLDYEKKLQSVGFTVSKHNPFEEDWVPNVRRHALDPRESVYVARKT